MSGELSTIQSLKAVDAWIDVINANINGGVRTGFKSSRLKFGGSNVDIQRAGTSTSLPLQLPEAGLQTANTVIDFSQGAITASTENTHLAIQGDGFFLVASPDMINTTAGVNLGMTVASPNAKMYLTRDGEFRTNAQGFLVNAAGYYLITWHATTVAGRLVPIYRNLAANSGVNIGSRAVYNDLDNPTLPTQGGFATLSTFLTGTASFSSTGATPSTPNSTNVSIPTVPQGKQSLQYSQFGSTIYDFGWVQGAAAPAATDYNSNIKLSTVGADGGAQTMLSKSLEASNASMTQSVPELSLAQKLFSALTKVLQTKQTNVDGVLNLVR
jgi:flagellar hook protein FlgE